MVFRPLSKRVVSDHIFTGTGLGLGLNGLGIIEPVQSNIPIILIQSMFVQHCNNTIIIQNIPSVAVLRCVGDIQSDILKQSLFVQIFYAEKRWCCSIYKDAGI